MIFRFVRVVRLLGLLTLLVIVLAPLRCAGQSIHALVIADLSPAAGWGDLEPHLTMDTLQVFTAFHNQWPESRLNYVSLQMAEDVHSTPSNILEALQEFKPTEQDVLFVFYTGHGGSDDRGQYFQLAGGKLYRDTLKSKMTALGARLNVLISDCCNTRSDGEGFFAPAPEILSPRQPSPLFRSLFLQDQGWVDLNACSPGEAAFFTADYQERGDLPGSLFTKRLAMFWEEHQQRSVQWDQLVREVSLGVMADFREQYPNGVSAGKGMPHQSEQNVHATVYPGMPPGTGPRTGLIVRDQTNGGALISSIRPDSPAAHAFDLGARNYVAIQPRGVITHCNGQPVRDAVHFVELAKDSPQIMRVKVQQGQKAREYLIRLSY